MNTGVTPAPHDRHEETIEAELQAARRRSGHAWLVLCGALAVHVCDEASTDFLSLWNPMVRAIREQFVWIPLPTFDYWVWLAGLILAVVVLVGLSRFVRRGAPWIRPVAYVLSCIMLGNGVAHLTASLYLKRPVPGVASSPLLLLAASYLLWVTREQSRLLHRRLV